MTGSGVRGARTTVLLEDTALDLALAHGYANVTVDQICEAAGVSQRTFFNHFPTKEDAVLGLDHPELDEQAARRFIASDGPLLPDAIGLVRFPAFAAEREPSRVADRMADRMRLLLATPALMARQMERVTALDRELRDVIELRLSRSMRDADETEVRRAARLLAHLVGGTLRAIGSGAAEEGESFADEAALTKAALAMLLSR